MGENNGLSSGDFLDGEGWLPTLEELKDMTEKLKHDQARAQVEMAVAILSVATASPETKADVFTAAARLHAEHDREGWLDVGPQDAKGYPDWGLVERKLLAAASECGITEEEAKDVLDREHCAVNETCRGCRNGRDYCTCQGGKGPGGGGGDSPASPPDLGVRAQEARESQAKAIVRLAKGEALELFHDPSGKTYAAVSVDGHKETHAISSNGFKRWIRWLCYTTEEMTPSSEALSGAIGTLEAQASFDSREHSVHVRTAGQEGRIYVDLCDPAWRAVETDADGWRIVRNPPVRFRRPNGLLPLPEPARGGTIADLRRFVNIADEDFILLITWMAASLRPAGPYPVLVLIGEQGSAKSTTARLVRSLIDPHTVPIRAEPRDDRDLMISATRSHVIAIDNISSIQPWLSDALCRLATGGGLSTRSLYSDDEETFFNATRPVVLTGISDFVVRGDLIDRSLFLNLLVIPESKRKPEAEFWSDFDRAAPMLFGALLDAVSGGMRLMPEIRLPGLPRMADFAVFGEAVSRSVGNDPGMFVETYNRNRQEANEKAIEDHPVARAVSALAADRGTWKGTVGELLVELESIVGAKTVESKFWPKSTQRLSSALRRSAPSLRMAGVDIHVGKHTKRGTQVVVMPIPEGTGSLVTSPSFVVSTLSRLDLSGDETFRVSSPVSSPRPPVGDPVTTLATVASISSPVSSPVSSPTKALAPKDLCKEGDEVTGLPVPSQGGEYTPDGGFRC
jgi:hypothetical protein